MYGGDVNSIVHFSPYAAVPWTCCALVGSFRQSLAPTMKRPTTQEVKRMIDSKVRQSKQYMSYIDLLVSLLNFTISRLTAVVLMMI